MKKIIFCILTALTLMFWGLKLADKIDWCWAWVFSPVWVPVALLFTIWLCSTIYCSIQYRRDPKFRKYYDAYNEHMRRESRGLAGRLEEMQREYEETRNLQNK